MANEITALGDIALEHAPEDRKPEKESKEAGDKAQADGAGEDEKSLIVRFAKPYIFEGKSYDCVDLNGIKQLKVEDAVDAQLRLFTENEVAAALVSETTTAFARMIAAKASGLPIEFFKIMPIGSMKRVARKIREYLNVPVNTEHHVVTFEKPYLYGGETVCSVDLSGVADLNSMNESAAENRMVRKGFAITENSLNFYYPCIIASMVTGRPEEFFMGLPIYEVFKLKNEVNSPDFFE